jgi:thiamine-phosphate pyrophosphorylase
MSPAHPLRSFAEDLVVFRQLTAPAERAEFTALMKRAYAQQMSSCAFVQRSPERQVSARIRRLCEAALPHRDRVYRRHDSRPVHSPTAAIRVEETRMTLSAKLRGLYAITDTQLIPRQRFIETVEAAVRGGATMVQLREKDTPPEEVIRLGRDLLAVTRRYGALLIINDHPSVAKAVGADGAHVGREDPPVHEARALLGPEAIIGASCYGDVTRAMAAEQEGADYVAFGTPFPSPTKAKRTDISLGIFGEVKQRVKVPVFAIGGITIDNARQVIDAGADGIAVVSGVFAAADVEAAAHALAQLFAEEKP